jgi:hypothetical protein
MLDRNLVRDLFFVEQAIAEILKHFRDAFVEIQLLA